MEGLLGWKNNYHNLFPSAISTDICYLTEDTKSMAS